MKEFEQEWTKIKTEPTSSSNDIETAERILGIENLILHWVQVAGLFIATAFVIVGLVGRKRRGYGITLFIFSVIILWIVLVEYQVKKKRLEEQGIKVPDRINLLALLIAGTIIIVLIIIWDYSHPDPV